MMNQNIGNANAAIQKTTPTNITNILNEEKSVVSGALWKMTGGLFGGKWKKRWVKIDAVECSYYTKSSPPQNRERPRKNIPIGKITSVRRPPRSTVKRDYSFQIITAHKGLVVTFAAEDEESMDVWMNAIKRQCDSYMETSHSKLLTDGKAIRGISNEHGTLGLPPVSKIVSNTESYRNSSALAGETKSTSITSNKAKTLTSSEEEMMRRTFMSYEIPEEKECVSTEVLGDILIKLGVTGLDADNPNRHREVISACDELDPFRNGVIHWMKFKPWWVGIRTGNRPIARNSTRTYSVCSMDDEYDEFNTTTTGGGDHELMNQDNIIPENWNQGYQDRMDKALASMNYTDQIKYGIETTSFVGDFSNLAKDAVEIIVQEMSLPDTMKSIPKSNVIGDERIYSGGSTMHVYFHHGILISLVKAATNDAIHQVDHNDSTTGNGIYGSGILDNPEVTARKMSAAKLHGLISAQTGTSKAAYSSAINNTMQAVVPRICTLLMCIVDYMGFRFEAIALTPIDDTKTLVYGRVPASGTLINKDRKFDNMLENVGKFMLAKPHEYTDDSGAKHNLNLGLNVKGHLCNDGRYYIHSYNQLLPADLPAPASEDVLTKQLRPEFIQTYGRPLSSDAFYADMGESSEDNDIEVCRASEYLIKSLLPIFTAKLDSLELLPYDSMTFTSALHSAGINVRHIGKILQHTSMPHVVDLVRVEMLARVSKVILNGYLRNITVQNRHIANNDASSHSEGVSADVSVYETNMDTLLQTYRATVIDFFNLVLGCGIESSEFWNRILIPATAIKFDISTDSLTSSFSKVDIHLPQLFLALQHHCCVLFEDSDSYSYDAHDPFDDSTLVHIHSRVSVAPNYGLECTTSASKAEMYTADMDYEKALESLNLRMALQPTIQAEACGTSRILNETAGVYLAMGDASNALRCANAALRDSSTFSGLSALIHMTLMRANFAMGSNNSNGSSSSSGSSSSTNADSYEARAREHFTLGKQAVIHHLGKHHPLVCEFYAVLGDLYLHNRGMVEVAVGLLDTAFEKAVKGLGSSHPLVAAYSSKLGHVCLLHHEYERAMNMFQMGLSINEKLYGETSQAVAASCQLLSEALWHRGELNEAYATAMRSLSIREGEYGGGHPKTMQTYTLLAILAESCGDIEKATEYLEKKLMVLKAGIDENSVAELQTVTCDIIRLCLDDTSLHNRETLNRANTEYPGITEDSTVMQFVVQELFSHNPSEYVNNLLNVVSSNVNTYDDEPLPMMQLAAVASLLQSMAGGSPVFYDDDLDEDKNNTQ